MGAPRKYDDETRARAVRTCADRLRESGDPQLAARRHVGQLLDIDPATMRSWIEREHPGGGAPNVVGVDAEEAERLRRENAELRWANDVLRTASAFFASVEPDRRLERSCSTSTPARSVPGSSRSAACCASTT